MAAFPPQPDGFPASCSLHTCRRALQVKKEESLVFDAEMGEGGVREVGQRGEEGDGECEREESVRAQ
ncbi:conserved hypothetical protein [Ricinus communis]|uniref:Uncharacterized protein n=1 Tax=Ricinus communis TaxID=3988 RepID=B9RRM6_RICCO|nr:conserved hypothetical protein [Ricinus communis]